MPADTSTREVTVYLGGWSSNGKLTAHLSDGSAADFTDASFSSANGTYQANYTLTYHAASAGQTLTLTWTLVSGFGNVVIDGAALAGRRRRARNPRDAHRADRHARLVQHCSHCELERCERCHRLQRLPLHRCVRPGFAADDDDRRDLYRCHRRARHDLLLQRRSEQCGRCEHRQCAGQRLCGREHHRWRVRWAEPLSAR